MKPKTQKSREELAAEYQPSHDSGLLASGEGTIDEVDECIRNAYLAGFDAATARLQAENEELRAALEFYAKEGNHTVRYGHEASTRMRQDRGNRAREILSKYPEVKA